MKLRIMRRKLRNEAFVALVIARLAVRFVSAKHLLAWAARSPRHPHRFADPDLPAQVAAAVSEAGLRIKAVCLPQALATQAMLRRRGIASRLCLGVARDGQALSAHAWVEIGQNVILGEVDPASARTFTPIAQFG